MDVKKLKPEEKKKILLSLKSSNIKRVDEWVQKLDLGSRSILVDECIETGIKELKMMEKKGELDKPEIKETIRELKKQGGKS